MANQVGVELVLEAAKQHGVNSEPDHEVGDLQDALRAMWELLPPAQKIKFMATDTVRELLENELSDVDAEEALEQLARMEKAALFARGEQINAVDAIVTAFPGLATDSEVDGSDLVEFISEYLDRLS